MRWRHGLGLCRAERLVRMRTDGGEWPVPNRSFAHDRHQWHGPRRSDGQRFSARPRFLCAPAAGVRHEAGVRRPEVQLLRRRAHRDRYRALRPRLCRGALRAAAHRAAPSVLACPLARGCRPLRRPAARDGRHDYPSAGGLADLLCEQIKQADGSWAPGYYSVLFEDPDGIRLEVNFVPGEGVLAKGTEFNAEDGYAGEP